MQTVAEQVRVHTKLVPDLSLLATIGDAEIEAIIDRSLKRLQIDRLHLVQFYWWDMELGDPTRALAVLKRCRGQRQDRPSRGDQLGRDRNRRPSSKPASI